MDPSPSLATWTEPEAVNASPSLRLWCTGVGSVNNTFGCPGVEEHTQFFKSVDDARKFRRRVLQCFERAALPETTPEVHRLPPLQV